MRKKATITLKNLAEDLNLSVSTVSRALNNHQDIRPATKELVCSYAKKMNYFPNLFAKGFRSQKTHIIGLIVPQISNYFTSTVIEGVLQEAEEKGYRVMVSESKNCPDKQEELIQMMRQFGVDGLLLSLTRKTKNVSRQRQTVSGLSGDSLFISLFLLTVKRLDGNVMDEVMGPWREIATGDDHGEA